MRVWVMQNHVIRSSSLLEARSLRATRACTQSTQKF